MRRRRGSPRRRTQLQVAKRRMRHGLGVWLATFAIPGLILLPGTPGMADPRPLVPPLASCNNYHLPCPSAAAGCIPLPYIPLSGPGYTGAPVARRWNLTVLEAVQVAIGNSEAVRNLGLVEAVSKNDLVRSVITSYDPVQAALKADSQWGIFDPLWTTGMIWDRMDIPPGTSFSGIGNRPPMLDTSDFQTSLEQLLPLGTRVRVDSVTNYLFNPQNPPGLNPNPQYFSYTQFGFSQPLLRGAGVDVTMAPIKIAAAQAEQTDWQFKQEMLALVRSVETTYWSLYAQQKNLRAIEDVLPLFRETVRLRQQQAGAALGNESDVFRARSDQLLFEQRRLDTMARIAEQQLVLRNLMGLSPSDDAEIWTLALPETARPTESLESAVMTAVTSRPDVLRQRLAVYVAQQERLLADTDLKPQLDVTGFWRLNGLDDNLGGSYGVQTNHDYRDWQLGVFFQVPLGRRQGFANLRAAEVKISRERAMLDQTAHQASFEVADAYRRINYIYQQRELVSDRVEALGQWRGGAQAQFENPPPGMSTAFALELYLQNLRDGLDATLNDNALLADFNSALARLEEVKGTLLNRRLVQIAGDLTDEIPEDLPTPELDQPDSVLPAPVEQSTPEAEEPASNGAAIEAPDTSVAEVAQQHDLQPLPPLAETVVNQDALVADQAPVLQPKVAPLPIDQPILEQPQAPVQLALPSSVCPRPQLDGVAEPLLSPAPRRDAVDSHIAASSPIQLRRDEKPALQKDEILLMPDSARRTPRTPLAAAPKAPSLKYVPRVALERPESPKIATPAAKSTEAGRFEPTLKNPASAGIGWKAMFRCPEPNALAAAAPLASASTATPNTSAEYQTSLLYPKAVSQATRRQPQELDTPVEQPDLVLPIAIGEY